MNTAATDPSSEEQPPLAGLAVLLVDDDADIREVLGLALADLGATVRLAEDGARAIEVLQGGLKPDAIILDLMMPVMNGWSVWDWLQSSLATQRIPVVVLTASGLRQGAVGHARILSKGMGPDALASAIQETIAGWSSPTK